MEAEAKRLHDRWLFGAVVVAAAAGWLMLVLLIWPMSGGDVWYSRWSWGALVLSTLLLGGGLLVVAAAGHILAIYVPGLRHHPARYLGTALLFPFALLVCWAIWLRPAHPVWGEARDVFDAYTHRFPEDALDTPSIEARDGSAALACAYYSGSEEMLDHDPPLGLRRFCVVIDTEAPTGSQVIKSFNTRELGEFRLVR